MARSLPAALAGRVAAAWKAKFPNKPKWYIVYFAPAAFALLTVFGSLLFGHRIMAIYAESAQVNRQWAGRVARYSDLGQVVAAVNAPGNDVFDTRDVASERARRDRALARFEEQLGAAKAELATAVPAHHAGPLLRSLDGFSEAVQDMVAEAEMIFALYGQGETGRAGERMATMDRRYARVLARLAVLNGQVREIQQGHLEQQIAAARHLRQFEYLGALLAALAVAGATVYGYKMAQRSRANEIKLQRYSVGLAKARDEAAAASRAKSDFLAAMSHEIRTPMTAVLGMADLLAVGSLAAKERRYVDTIRNSGRHLLSIIDDILDFSRIEAGGLTLERIDFPLDVVLEQVVSLLAPQAADRGLELIVRRDPDAPPVVKGDPTRLQQVLINLVGNGIKFTPRGSVSVRLKHRPAGEGRVRLRFEVEDTGIGLSARGAADVFEAFVQADRSTTRRYGGSGLGLAISKRLVEAMGGQIAVESTPGAGSLFWFEIPFEIGDAAVGVDRATPEPGAMRPLRVLVVEDVEANRALLGEMLGRYGHEIAFAGNGAEAVALVARETFDAVLMDVQMPVMDGVAATRLIRMLDPPVRDVPIVGLTADVVGETRERYIAAGMNRCLPKPVGWPELFATLAEVAGPSDPTRRPAAMPSLVAPPRSPSLLDIDEERFAELRGRVLEEAQESCGRMRTLPAGSEELKRAAHKLKGTAGLFKLDAIVAAAAEIEAAARDGADGSESIARLTAAVADAREAPSDPLPFVAEGIAGAAAGRSPAGSP